MSPATDTAANGVEPPGCVVAPWRAFHEQASAQERVAGTGRAESGEAKSPVLGCGRRAVLFHVGRFGVAGKKNAVTTSISKRGFLFSLGAVSDVGLGRFASDDIALSTFYSDRTEKLIKLSPALKRFGSRFTRLVGVAETKPVGRTGITRLIPLAHQACPNDYALASSTSLAVGNELAGRLSEACGIKLGHSTRLHRIGRPRRSSRASLAAASRQTVGGGDPFAEVFPGGASLAAGGEVRESPTGDGFVSREAVLCRNAGAQGQCTRYGW